MYEGSSGRFARLSGCGALLLAGLMAGCASEPSPGRDAALDAVAARGTATGVPGVAVAVVAPDGSIRTGAAGVANRLTGEPYTPASQFHAGSTTKAVTAAAVLMLVDRGRLSLDDTLTNLVPSDVVDGVPDADRMTVRQLLEHRTGLYSPNNDPQYLARYIGPERQRLPFWTAEEIVAFAADPANEPLFEPGEGQAYGDINYVLLGLVVREVAGEPLREFVRREIFEPLGMDNSWYLSAHPEAPRARGYTLESEILRTIGLDPAMKADEDGYIDTTDAQEQSDGAAGIITSVGDLARFAHALTRGDLLSPESRELVLAAAHLAGASGDEALGILRGYMRDYGRIVTAEGDGPGTNVVWALEAESGKLAVVALSLFGRWDETDLIFDELLPAALGG